MIFVIEDNPDDRETLEELIDSELHCYPSGEVALERLKDVDLAKVDLIICDQRLPGLTGLETIAKIRAMPHGESARTVMLTSASRDTLETMVTDLGVLDVLHKPETLAEWRDVTDRLKELRRQVE